MPTKQTSRLNLLSRADSLRPRWALDELDSLDGNPTVDALINAGAGLSNDDSAAWVVTAPVQGAQGGAMTQAIRLRSRPSATAPFSLQTIVMHQLSGTPVNLSIGGMNRQHQIAATARSHNGASVWAVLANPQAWLPPSSGGALSMAADIDDNGYIVGANRQGGMDAAACLWPSAGAAAPQLLPQVSAVSSAACAVSPSTRAVAGNAVTAVGPGDHTYPWYIDRHGAVHLAFVTGASPGAVTDINDAYTCCGANFTASGRRAWRWAPGNGVTWLRGLQAQGTEQASEAYSLNAAGDAVGRSAGAAVMWVAGATAGVAGGQRLAVDLNSLAPASDVHLSAAVRINDSQSILCFGWRRDARGVTSGKVFLLRNTGPRLPFPLP